MYSGISDSIRKSDNHIRKVCSILRQIIDFLSGFKNNYTKKFNVSKLAKYLELNSSEIEEFISVLLYFQEQLNTIFDQYILEKKVENGQTYLVTKRHSRLKYAIPNIIYFSQSQVHLINDIIYMFKQVRKGKGFFPNMNGTDIFKDINLLRDTHPFLFEIRDDGLIYPSKFGLELGELIISYSTSNKKIDKIKLHDTTIIVNTHG